MRDDGGLAACDSTADGRTVGSFTALELGELGSGTGYRSIPALAKAACDCLPFM